MATPIKPLSDAIFSPVSKAYKAGGFGLAFLTLGAFLMLVAFFLPERKLLSYLVLGIGLVLIILPCILFFAQDVRPLFAAQRSIQTNRELIDAVQRAALQATEMASDLQALAFKNATAVASAMQLVRPQLRQIPILGKIADSEIMGRTDKLSAAIVDYTGKAKRVIADLERSLVQSDPHAITKYIQEIAGLRVEIKELLTAP